MLKGVVGGDAWSGLRFGDRASEHRTRPKRAPHAGIRLDDATITGVVAALGGPAEPSRWTGTGSSVGCMTSPSNTFEAG